MKKVLRSASSLALLLSLAACAPLSLDFLRPEAQGLDTLTQKVGHEAPELAFSFEFDDKADAAEGEVGSGYIVVTQDGKELQALPHAFEMPRERLDASGWLQFKDFNGDGLLDFKVTRLYAMDGKLPVDSLYQFDPKTGRYAQIDLVSNAGEIQPSAPNCVSLKVAGASGSPKVESHCYVAASGRWVRGDRVVSQRRRPDPSCDQQPVASSWHPGRGFRMNACRRGYRREWGRLPASRSLCSARAPRPAPPAIRPCPKAAWAQPPARAALRLL